MIFSPSFFSYFSKGLVKGEHASASFAFEQGSGAATDLNHNC